MLVFGFCLAPGDVSVLCGFVVRFLVVVVVVVVVMVVMVVVMVVVAVSEMVVMVFSTEGEREREREREREPLLGRIIGTFISQLPFTPTIATAYAVATSATFILFKNEDGTQQTQPT